MQSDFYNTESFEFDSRWEAIESLRESLERGRDWPEALLEAMSLWTTPEETHEGRRYVYFIGGEAFDWLLLAERLCETARGLIPQAEVEELLFHGRFPDYFDASRVQDLLGVEKYRGYLNYHYGVVVEEALQLAAEREVHKRHLSNGNQYQDDFSDEAFGRIYRDTKDNLLRMFREDRGYADSDEMSFSEYREFTYWLFKYRLKTSDKAKTASDTQKGLRQLHQMMTRRRNAVSVR